MGRASPDRPDRMVAFSQLQINMLNVSSHYDPIHTTNWRRLVWNLLS